MNTVCSSLNVAGMDANTFDWMKTFCACPEAKQLVNEAIAAKRDVDPLNPQIQVNLLEETNSKTPLSTLIELALAFLNTKNSKEKKELQAIATSGKLSMDDYALQTETLRYETLIKGALLQFNCQKAWKVENDFHVKMIPHSTNYPLNFYLRDTESTCQADSIRKQWIHDYQDKYCKKNPKDTRSCETKESELCDYNDFLKLSRDERNKFMAERMDKVFHKLQKKEEKMTTRTEPVKEIL